MPDTSRWMLEHGGRVETGDSVAIESTDSDILRSDSNDGGVRNCVNGP